MALQIIARGKVETTTDKWGQHWFIGGNENKTSLGVWARNYVGKTIVISLQEEEPILNHSLKELLVPA